MRIAFIVVAAAVGAAAVVPVQASTNVPLSNLKLVAEKAAPYDEIAAAQQNGKNGTNGNQNGNQGFIFGNRRGYYVHEWYFEVGSHPERIDYSDGELGDLDLSSDSAPTEVGLR